ncbi:hypothetical protein TNCV_273371 [Trichonephila clavipes]|nr:hypothetical protein TNCV_273371 [Trichonephila clavipes]
MDENEFHVPSKGKYSIFAFKSKHGLICKEKSAPLILRLVDALTGPLKKFLPMGCKWLSPHVEITYMKPSTHG